MLIPGGIIQKQMGSEHITQDADSAGYSRSGLSFKKSDVATRNDELTVFLHPRVIQIPEDADEQLQRVDQNAPEMRELQNDR